jgi:transcriptional regulator with GAF, ATPase, and Fis domain/CHASE2 domain-containing sensor protein
MAGAPVTRQRWKFSVLAATAALAVAALLQGPLNGIERGVTDFKYRLRGSHAADSNIVIVYIDNNAIRTLGWPVRRNFYALMVRVLSDLRVRAIGIEVLFEDRSETYPEYDSVLRSVVGQAGNVVLTSYFEHFFRADGAWAGEKFHAPFLKDDCRAIGHVNLTEAGEVPAKISTDSGFDIDCFGIALLMAAGEIEAPVDVEAIRPNYPGPLTAFTVYPFLDVLQSYDAMRAGGRPSIPVANLKDKIVLIGFVAEGRSAVVTTPFDSRYPSVGVHATAMDNILLDRSLRMLPLALTMSTGFAIALLCCAIPLVTARAGPAVVAVIAVNVTGLVSQWLFAAQAIDVPTATFLLCVVIGAGAAVIFRNDLARKRMRGLEADKETMLNRLRDKEEQVRVLEHGLLDATTRGLAEKTGELQTEIRRYKAEIKELAGRVDDMLPSKAEDGGAAPFEFEGIIGFRNGPMAPVVDFIEKVAASDAPVLILGESGTGKELVAKALHNRSPRSRSPFIAVNCGALSETLLESELFGHEKGAFTGAVREKAGRFELADGGTILLDEIGDVGGAFQVKLLRVLQEGEFERVGGTSTRRVNVRVLAATNRNLKEMISGGSFREDLYYRLNVLSVEIPPLRDRGEDIALLARSIIAREGSHLTLSRNVISVIESYHWPGNIRELQSVLKRGALLAQADGRSMVSVKDLPETLRDIGARATNLEEQILDAIRAKSFSRSAVSETAEELGGLNRGTVAEYLRGEFLRTFVEHGFDIEATTLAVSLSQDDAVNDRVRKRLREYLTNISEAVNRAQPWESSKEALRAKTKNLPERYHDPLERVAEAYFRNLWNH